MTNKKQFMKIYKIQKREPAGECIIIQFKALMVPWEFENLLQAPEEVHKVLLLDVAQGTPE